MPRVNSAGAASFMSAASTCRFLLCFGFAGGFLAPDLTFPMKSLYNITVTLNAYRNSPRKASLCLIGRRRERVEKYFDEVRKLKAENTAFVFARIPHLQMN